MNVIVGGVCKLMCVYMCACVVFLVSLPQASVRHLSGHTRYEVNVKTGGFSFSPDLSSMMIMIEQL